MNKLLIKEVNNNTSTEDIYMLFFLCKHSTFKQLTVNFHIKHKENHPTQSIKSWHIKTDLTLQANLSAWHSHSKARNYPRSILLLYPVITAAIPKPELILDPSSSCTQWSLLLVLSPNHHYSNMSPGGLWIEESLGLSPGLTTY